MQLAFGMKNLLFLSDYTFVGDHRLSYSLRFPGRDIRYAVNGCDPILDGKVKLIFVQFEKNSSKS